MENSKGKPVATSVPSITIKFHANAEQLEELYTMSDEESTTTTTTSDSIATITTTTATTNESEKSPLKLFPRLVKRSTSIDITPVKQQQTDSSPPTSDPWRFFSDIKGKITKSVEDKIIEIKSRNSDESPSKQLKDNSSSLSDSEEMSESSLSRTCGLLSTTTEGVEMSTDDDDDDDESSIINNDDNDHGNDKKKKSIKIPKNLRQRFKLLKTTSSSSTTINKQNNNNITINNLTKLYNINTDRIEQALPEIENTDDNNDDGIENAVEAIEDEYDKKIINTINENYANINIDNDNLIKINEIQGCDLNKFDKTTTVFAPVGFVDMRTNNNSDESIITNNNNNNNKRFNTKIIKIIVIFVIYLLLYCYSSYWSGVLFGIITTHLFITIKTLLSSEDLQSQQQQQQQVLENIIEIEPIEEYKPLKKYEGWMNELPEFYDPHTYHINKTQSIYLRLQGNLLRISHTRMKISKRALWNERKISKPLFTHHRIYNLLNAKIELLPKGLAKKRHWSKKYPICIVLTTATDQINFDTNQQQQQQDDDDDLLKNHQNNNKKKLSINQQFSKLAADDDNSEHSRASTPSSTDLTEQFKKYDFDVDEDDPSVMSETWSTLDDQQQQHQYETKLYLFGRTDREKEEWFRRLQLATTYSNIRQLNNNNDDDDNNETNYLKYMEYFNKNLQLDYDNFEKIKDDTTTNKLLIDEYCLNNILWINTLFGRILYDCLYNNNLDFTQKIKERIQRKLSTIKLPYFIEEILISELTLGHTPPIIHKAKKPIINERGLWIDLDITYEGLIVLILQTKLNLMKLKQPHTERMNIDEKPAIFNSDLDDSAESSSDDNLTTLTDQSLLDQTTNTTTTSNSNPSSSSSKKFIRMVDKIAESKFFQAAAENRLIKKAMENVSNTDLSLRCELKQLIGTLVINIPTPPSDRLWIGFQPLPTILMKAQPIVGETNITFMRITGWIEKKLLQEFQKVLVLPNMEDLVIPLMTPKIIE